MINEGLINGGSIESLELMKDESTISNQEELNHTTTNIVPAMTLSWHDVTAFGKEKKSIENRQKKPDSCTSRKFTTDSDVENFFEGKRVLDNAFGVARPGEVIAIIGPSGAGKTTLLNILTQRNCGDLTILGSVKVNGLRVTRSFMKKVCAYVQQNDLFIGGVTVEEHLKFMAKLKMGRKFSREDQEKRVEQVMQELGLNGIANSIIGTRTRKGLSGGEKKRLAFASEILTSPPILICDEPTSGLDSFLAYQVITVLKKLAAKKRMTILLTIHQPSSQVFQLFDSVYIMVDGRVAFCGNQSQAESLWTELGIGVPVNFNPCDHYLATLSKRNRAEEAKKREQIKQICEAFQESENGKKLLKEATGRCATNDDNLSESSSEEWRRRYDSFQEKKFNASFFQQVSALTWRASKSVLREPTLLRVQLTQSVVIALLTGLVYTNNNPLTQQKIMNVNGSIYQMVSNMAFMFQFSVVHHFCLEIDTFYRETSSGLYRVSAYFLAKNLAELPSYAMSAVLFTSILYWMSGLVPVVESFLIYLLVGFLVQNIAISIGYMFSCVFGTVSLAVAVMPIFVVPMMAFGGFFINQDTLPLFFLPLKYLSYFGYGYEAVAITQWTHIDEIPGCEKTLNCRHNGTEVLNSLSFKENNLYIDILVLVGMLITFRFIAFLALLFRVKRRR